MQIVRWIIQQFAKVHWAECDTCKVLFCGEDEESLGTDMCEVTVDLCLSDLHITSLEFIHLFMVYLVI
jgi:hypothetical protein